MKESMKAVLDRIEAGQARSDAHDKRMRELEERAGQSFADVPKDTIWYRGEERIDRWWKTMERFGREHGEIMDTVYTMREDCFEALIDRNSARAKKTIIALCVFILVVSLPAVTFWFIGLPS